MALGLESAYSSSRGAELVSAVTVAGPGAGAALCGSPFSVATSDLPSLCSLVQAIRVFFTLRSLSLQLRGEPETQLPLTREEDLIKTDDVLDLSESAQGVGTQSHLVV